MDYKKQIVADLQTVIGEVLSAEELYHFLEVPKMSGHGDYAFPTFSLAKVYRKAPNMIAEDLIEKLDQTNYEKIVTVGGYINFFLNKEVVSQEVLTTILNEKEHYGDDTIGNNGNIPIDLSSPNIAKPMSMGHLRSTVIGNSLAELSKKIGYNPVKINHLGDWGTQFGKLIVAFKKWGNEEDVRKNPIAELLKLYVQFHDEAEENPELEDEGRAWFRKLEQEDPEAVRLWEWFREESLKEFQKVYDMLGVTFDSYNGEAFFNDKMDVIIDELEAKNLLISDQGADIVDLEKYDLNPALIRKSDGATLYMTRDLAAANFRINNYDFVESLYVVGNEQSIHFKQLKAVLKEMGHDWSDNIKHIPFGLITSGGKKLSTRKGNVILLEEVLNEAINSIKKGIEEKNPELENKDEVAHQVGVGAVIFHDLKNDRMNNFDFNLDELLQFEGETGPYVQYTRSRCESILAKAEWSPENIKTNINLSDEESWEVIKCLNNFPVKVKEAYQKYEPSIMAKFLIDLAQKFNKYYSKHKILIEDGEKEARLSLVYSVSIVIKEGLRLLGVQAPNKM
ncbi:MULTISPECIES: arginine--tRNA ligase [Vagococcus]|uniref:Arginine--tRNA ligase n=1 Tax=Vagococcus fluvialis bH819 TaxID=1255619 RepID=A0A1X6WRF0_9ENTE|nr:MULTISPECIES: arginine--tRNA ligase [Vagococcus]SLM86931.1 Arginyl-tRNA synthetase [Vagococcus fluvialis bH819]HCM88936.1 arginine--tRNA ligase [Vagococcus sp.]